MAEASAGVAAYAPPSPLPADAVRTFLVGGEGVPDSDAAVQMALLMAQPLARPGETPYVIGIRNGSGRVYRTVLVDGAAHLASIAELLAELGYESLPQGFGHLHDGLDLVFAAAPA